MVRLNWFSVLTELLKNPDMFLVASAEFTRHYAYFFASFKNWPKANKA